MKPLGIDVFVSRPNWVDTTFQHGLKNFLQFLESHGLNPRTLGVTDSGIKPPMDEVIRLMDQCSGVVILGYPQIVATGGSVKGKPLAPPLTLATEWNHIEAGLGYARGLPLLVIHHPGVSRGVFDHGVIPAFIHEVDLENRDWPLGKTVSDAIIAWKMELERARPSHGDDVSSSTTDDLDSASARQREGSRRPRGPVASLEDCHGCDGHGRTHDPVQGWIKHDVCRGFGEILVNDYAGRPKEKRDCRYCDGEGTISGFFGFGDETCPICRGKGFNMV
jgi:hypothetical protein